MLSTQATRRASSTEEKSVLLVCASFAFCGACTCWSGKKLLLQVQQREIEEKGEFQEFPVSGPAMMR